MEEEREAMIAKDKGEVANPSAVGPTRSGAGTTGSLSALGELGEEEEEEEEEEEDGG